MKMSLKMRKVLKSSWLVVELLLIFAMFLMLYNMLLEPLFIALVQDVLPIIQTFLFAGLMTTLIGYMTLNILIKLIK